MPLLEDAAFTGIREALEITLTHRCTIQSQTTAGAEGDDGHTDSIDTRSPDLSVPCRYETVQRVVRDETGVTLVSISSLALSATQTVTPGDTVLAITDQLGAVLHPGPLRVERVLDDTAGLGAALLPTYELRAARAT